MKPYVLLVNCSPRKNSNTGVLLKHAQSGIASAEGIKTIDYHIYGKTFHGCAATCVNHCSKTATCVIDDDFNEFLHLWLNASGIIYAAPVYHMGPPGQIKCAIDRLGNVIYNSHKKGIPRFLKPCGVISQGTSRWGGQEITAQFFLSHIVVMNCLPVTGDMPPSYIGALGWAPSKEPDSITKDADALSSSKNLGLRLAQAVKIVQAGYDKLKHELDDDAYDYQHYLDQQ